MNINYYSLIKTPINKLGKDNSFNLTSLEENKLLYDKVKHKIFKIIPNHTNSEFQIKVLSTIHHIIVDIYKILKILIEIEICKKKKTSNYL